MEAKRVSKEKQHKPQTLGAKHISRRDSYRPNGSNDRPNGWADRTTRRHFEDLARTFRGPYPQKNYPTAPLQCLLCKGPHKLSYCPHRASLSALQVSIKESNDTRVETTQDKREDQDNPQMGALKFLSALQRKVEPKEIIEKGLMFIDTTINSQPSKSTLIDSGATHNFITDQEARRLGLTIENDPRKIKIVNSEVLPIVGVSKRVPLKLGAWSGVMDLVVVRMDDFGVVLGMDFLLERKVLPMPLAKCLVITDHNPTVIPTSIKQPGNLRIISAI